MNEERHRGDRRVNGRIDVIGQNGNDGEHYAEQECLHTMVSILTDGVRTTGLLCADCGAEFKERQAAATAYVQRQTARRLLEGVVRELDKGVQRRATSGDTRGAGWLHAQAEQVRDALALLVGDG